MLHSHRRRQGGSGVFRGRPPYHRRVCRESWLLRDIEWTGFDREGCGESPSSAAGQSTTHWGSRLRRNRRWSPNHRGVFARSTGEDVPLSKVPESAEMFWLEESKDFPLGTVPIRAVTEPVGEAEGEADLGPSQPQGGVGCATTVVFVVAVVLLSRMLWAS